MSIFFKHPIEQTAYTIAQLNLDPSDLGIAKTKRLLSKVIAVVVFPIMLSLELVFKQSALYLSSFVTRNVQTRASCSESISKLSLGIVKSAIAPLFAEFASKDFLNESHKLELGLDKWIQKAPKNEHGSCVLAKERIMKCFENRSDELDFSYLGLSSIPQELSLLSHVKALDLRGNKLNHLPTCVLELHHLKELYLGNNSLADLPARFECLKDLEILYLDRNKFSRLPQVLENLPKLKELSITYNNLRSLSITPGSFRSLKNLYLNQNAIVSLDSTIGHLTTLERLYLSYNPLNHIADEIGQLKNLIVLQLDGNLLVSLNESIAELDALEYISCDQEQIQQLEAMPFNRADERIIYLTNLDDDIFGTGIMPLRLNHLQEEDEIDEEEAFMKLSMEHIMEPIYDVAKLQPKESGFWDVLEEIPDFKRFVIREMYELDFDALSESDEQEFSETIVKIMEALVESREFRDEVRVEINHVISSCSDRLTYGLDKLILSYKFSILNLPEIDYAALTIGAIRLAMIDLKASRMNCDPIETALMLTLENKERLKLPSLAKSMRYSAHSAVDERTASKIGHAIKRKTTSSKDVLRLLSQNSQWQKRLRQLDPDLYDSLLENPDWDINIKLYEAYRAQTKAWLDVHYQELRALI